MASRSAYSRLVDRLNRFTQGAPPSEVLHKILELLFREEDAGLAALHPIKPFTAAVAARVWKRSESESRLILERLASKRILLDTDCSGESTYTLPPPMAGFFEFSMMRIREDIDQKLLVELFYQDLNVEKDSIRALFTYGETQLGCVFVNEEALPESLSHSVLDFEHASEVINTATQMAIGICYCRHKSDHLGRACDAQMDICMTFNSVASSLVRHGIARAVDRKEGFDLLQQAYDRNWCSSAKT